MATREWILKKNCSITPRQLAEAYMALCVASFLVASYFVVHGAWLVLVFSVLEMAAVGVAFMYFARHATDRELIALGDEGLVVQLVQAEQVSQYWMNPQRTRVELPDIRHGLIGLEADGDRVEVGRYLTEQKRRAFAQELKNELIGYRAGSK
ncbi:MAG: hypothetical protein RL404_2236 [Pseudomonadota bacterium]|jgi:uncharacterized membrane protein